MWPQVALQFLSPQPTGQAGPAGWVWSELLTPPLFLSGNPFPSPSPSLSDHHEPWLPLSMKLHSLVQNHVPIQWTLLWGVVLCYWISETNTCPLTFSNHFSLNRPCHSGRSSLTTHQLTPSRITIAKDWSIFTYEIVLLIMTPILCFPLKNAKFVSLLRIYIMNNNNIIKSFGKGSLIVQVYHNSLALSL